PPPVSPLSLPSFPTRRSSDLHVHALCLVVSAFFPVLAIVAPVDDKDRSRLCLRVALHLRRQLADLRRVREAAMLIRYDGDEELRSEEHTSELQSRSDLVCRLL